MKNSDVSKYHGNTVTRPATEKNPALNPRSARLLREFIYENLSERITLDELAALAGMMTQNLLIVFRKSNLKPAAVLRRAR